MTEGAVAVALGAIGLAAAVLKILDYLLKRSDKTIAENTNASNKQALATSALATAVTKMNEQLAKRDKRDEELHELVLAQTKTLRRIDSNTTQVLGKLTVEHELVKEQTVISQTVVESGSGV